LLHLENKWLPGIGPELASTLNRAGLPLIGDIADTPPDQLSLFAGKNARMLWEFANGIDERPVVAVAPAAKSYSEQQTFEADTADEGFVLAVLRSMADRLFAKARAEGQAARTLSVRVRYNDFEECVRSCSLDEPTDLETTTYGHIDTLLKKAWERRVSLRLVSLKLSNLYKGAFFTELALIPSAQNKATLHRAALAIDEIRMRHGSGAILRSHDLRLRKQAGPPDDLKNPPQVLIRRAPQAPAAILHFRSCYSFMDSLLTPERIVQLAAEADCKVVGLCDPNLHAAVPFFRAAASCRIEAHPRSRAECEQPRAPTLCEKPGGIPKPLPPALRAKNHTRLLDAAPGRPHRPIEPSRAHPLRERSRSAAPAHFAEHPHPHDA
jgi:hypothetical protein